MAEYPILKNAPIREDWDGYGAKPVGIDSVNEAREFISLLPSFFHKPEVVAEPAGEIGLEWYNEKNKIFALSFNGRKMIAYAGIFGSNKTHGVEYFENSIPSIIIDSLKRLYFLEILFEYGLRKARRTAIPIYTFKKSFQQGISKGKI